MTPEEMARFRERMIEMGAKKNVRPEPIQQMIVECAKAYVSMGKTPLIRGIFLTIMERVRDQHIAAGTYFIITEVAA